MRFIPHFLALLLLLAAGPIGAAETVDINRASAEQLAAAIEGVGQARAEAIVSYRDAHGPFRSVDDLTLVQGIGQRTLDANRGKLSVGAAK
jgi:competence protein ComEA